ncbi:MAG: rod shape-determining protein RodA [Desulfovibrio sp.]|nr:MAG: rod shape-determining protein RodA [Desulfovibrio sp.]
MTPVDRRLLAHVNWPLLGLTLILFGVGVLNLYSASGFRLEEGFALNPYYRKQMIWGLLGLGVMILFMVFNYRHIKIMAWPLFVLTIGLLIAVPFWGKTIGGAQRWLSLGFFNLQPSEVAKISVLFLAARILSGKPEKMGMWELIGILVVGFIPAGLIILQPDLGSGMNLLLLLGGIILYRGLKPNVWKVLIVVVPVVMWLFYSYGLKEYQQQRIKTFLNPGEFSQGAGYQIMQSKIAIGSGGLWGKGFLAGTQSQLRFLPERHTDFAVAVFGEEWGFVGSITLLSLFCLFLYSVFATARDAKDRFGSFLAAGVFFYFFWQILINMGMVLGLMPVVGIPLPFLSYGGSNAVVNFCLIGLVLNVSMRRYVFKE